MPLIMVEDTANFEKFPHLSTENFSRSAAGNEALRNWMILLQRRT